MSYQWRKNGVKITGATKSSYITPPTTAADNGSLFSVVVSNSIGSVTSNNATTYGSLESDLPRSALFFPGRIKKRDYDVCPLYLSCLFFSDNYARERRDQVVGLGIDSLGQYEGFCWSPSTGQILLQTLGGQHGAGFGINRNGVFAGEASNVSEAERLDQHCLVGQSLFPILCREPIRSRGAGMAALCDLAATTAKLLGWEVVPKGPTVNVVGNQVAVVCDETTRERLIPLREKVTLAEHGAKQRKEAPTPEPAGASREATGQPGRAKRQLGG